MNPSSASELLQGSINRFFLRNDHDGLGATRLSKFRCNYNWISRCAVWPISGGRRFIHVPLGDSNLGWSSFFNMLSTFLKKRELLLQLTHQPSLMNLGPSFSSKARLEPPRAREKSFSYVEAVQSSILVKKNQSMESFWIQKNSEVFKENFNNLWVISRLFVFNDWMEITKTLEELFQTKVIIHPLSDENALIKID